METHLPDIIYIVADSIFLRSGGCPLQICSGTADLECILPDMDCLHDRLDGPVDDGAGGRVMTWIAEAEDGWLNDSYDDDDDDNDNSDDNDKREEKEGREGGEGDRWHVNIPDKSEGFINNK